MSSGGDNPRQLTTNPNDDNVPSWSPDGKQIAYHAYDGNDYEIRIFTLVTGTDTPITNNNTNDWNPVWSPDGSQIAFYSTEDGDYEIYLMDIDGSNRHQITHNATIDRFPGWSPDGNRITYTTYLGGKYQIYIMSKDGTRSEFRAYGCISYFSPDGKQILYGQYCSAGDYGKILIMNSDGSGLPQVLHESGRNAAWSPDGSQIIFESDSTGNSEIWIMDADGSNPIQLTFDPAMDAAPVLQPIPRP